MSGERWLALDGLRGVAILLVVAAHAGGTGIGAGGMVGVTLFFVLSGFLITNLLIEELDDTGRIDLKAFYGRRALRLLPALGFYLVGISSVISALRLDVPVLGTLWPPVLYVSNYVQVLGMDLYAHRHTWSLAVEEHFYLVWPLLVGLGATRKSRVLGLVVLILFTWRLAVYALSDNVLWQYIGTDTNSYALGIGALLASLRREFGLPDPSRRVAAMSVAGLVILSLVPAETIPELYGVSLWVSPLAALLAVAAVWASVEGPSRAFLTSRTLRWFGLISYSLYLWHAPILQFPGLSETPGARLLGVGIAMCLAWLSWRLIEGPILRSRLRRRFGAKRLVEAAANAG